MSALDFIPNDGNIETMWSVESGRHNLVLLKDKGDMQYAIPTLFISQTKNVPNYRNILLTSPQNLARHAKSGWVNLNEPIKVAEDGGVWRHIVFYPQVCDVTKYFDLM